MMEMRNPVPARACVSLLGQPERCPPAPQIRVMPEGHGRAGGPAAGRVAGGRRRVAGSARCAGAAPQRAQAGGPPARLGPGVA